MKTPKYLIIVTTKDPRRDRTPRPCLVDYHTANADEEIFHVYKNHEQGGNLVDFQVFVIGEQHTSLKDMVELYFKKKEAAELLEYKRLKKKFER